MTLVNENLYEYMFVGFLVFRGDRKVTEAWTGWINGWTNVYMRI
jgi:hypothetical protein